jgi:hypothetical protein
VTCIAGIVENGTVYIGGDSAGVAGWSLAVRADAKVWATEEFAFGFTSSFRMGQLLRYKLNPPARLVGQSVDEYMVGPWIDAVRQRLKAGGYARTEEGAEKGGTFLVGYEGRLFEISSDYQVGELRLRWALKPPRLERNDGDHLASHTRQRLAVYVICHVRRRQSDAPATIRAALDRPAAACLAGQTLKACWVNALAVRIPHPPVQLPKAMGVNGSIPPTRALRASARGRTWVCSVQGSSGRLCTSLLTRLRGPTRLMAW